MNSKNMEKLCEAGSRSEARRKDGTCFFASQECWCGSDNNGKIQGTETLVRDITNLKKALKKRLKNV